MNRFFYSKQQPFAQEDEERPLAWQVQRVATLGDVMVRRLSYVPVFPPSLALGTKCRGAVHRLLLPYKCFFLTT